MILSFASLLQEFMKKYRKVAANARVSANETAVWNLADIEL